MKSFKEFIAESVLTESALPEYKIEKTYSRNQYVILFPVLDDNRKQIFINHDANKGLSVKVTLDFINYDSKKGYEAKMTFTGGERILKNIKLDYEESGESVKKRFGDKLVKALLSNSKFKRSYPELCK